MVDLAVNLAVVKFDEGMEVGMSHLWRLILNKQQGFLLMWIRGGEVKVF